MEPIIKINGHTYPAPDNELTLRVATLVDSARNADAVVISQKIGRDQGKIENLEWTYLDAVTWSHILQEFEPGFYATVTFPDMVTNSWVTRKMYPGDRTAQPFTPDPNTGLPKDYLHCKVNIIDVGE